VALSLPCGPLRSVGAATELPAFVVLIPDWFRAEWERERERREIADLEEFAAMLLELCVSRVRTRPAEHNSVHDYRNDP